MFEGKGKGKSQRAKDLRKRQRPPHSQGCPSVKEEPMLTLTPAGSFLRYRARLKRSRIPPLSRCGRIPPFVPPRTRLSSDHKGKRHSRARKGQRPANHCKVKAARTHPKASSVVLATITGLAGRAGLASCLVVRNHKQATSKNSLRWETMLPVRLGLIDEQV